MTITKLIGTDPNQVPVNGMLGTLAFQEDVNFNDLTNKTSGTGDYTTTGNFTSAALIPTGATVPANGLYLPAANSVAVSTSSTGRLFIDSSGRVGIGTTSPSTALHVATATGSAAPVPTELRLATTTGASDWSATDPWSKISFYSADNARTHAEISVGSINTTGAASWMSFSILDGAPNALREQLRFDPVGTNLTQTVFSTSGTERMRINSSGNVGIGTNNPVTLLHLRSTGTPILRIQDDDGTNQYSDIYNSAGQSYYNAVNNASPGAHIFLGGGTERARIDSSGRLLVGTSSALGGYGYTPRFQVVGTDANSASTLLHGTATPTYPTFMRVNAGNTAVAANDRILDLRVYGYDGTNSVRAAGIYADVDGTPGANSMPGRLIFATTPSGSSTPTERMRIDSSGTVSIAGALELNGTLLDVNNEAGTAGQILSSTGTGVDWVNSVDTVPSASETVQGKVELATAAETQAGTDSVRAVHPAGLKSVVDIERTTSDGKYVDVAGDTMTGNLTVPSLNGGQLAGFRNVIINGTLSINQRGVTIGAAAVGQYGPDRWKKTGASTMTQIIEDGNFKPGATYTLSGTGVTTQQLTAPASGNWTLPDIPTTATNIQLELGTVATPFEARPSSIELVLCLRYYEKSSGNFAVWSGTTVVGSETFVGVGMRGFKRVAPTVTPNFENGVNFGAAAQRIVNVYEAGFVFGKFPNAAGNNSYYVVSWTADAEL